MKQPDKYKTCQTVLVKTQSRDSGAQGYAEAIAMVGHICVVNADIGAAGVSVLDPGMKSAWVFDRNEIAPCPRLSTAELRAIKMMAAGYRAEPASGLKMAIAGEQVCDINVIRALAGHGLVTEVPGTKAWTPTDAGTSLNIQAA